MTDDPRTQLSQLLQLIDDLEASHRRRIVKLRNEAQLLTLAVANGSTAMPCRTGSTKNIGTSPASR